MPRGLKKPRCVLIMPHLTAGSRICNHARSISWLELLLGSYRQKSFEPHPRVDPYFQQLANVRLLIPAKDIPSLFATTARASVKKSFAGKNNAMSAFLSAGAKSVAKCIICSNKTAPGKKLCSDHEHLEMEVAAEKQAAMEKLGEDSNLLDSACRSCQANIIREVLCTNLSLYR